MNTTSYLYFDISFQAIPLPGERGRVRVQKKIINIFVFIMILLLFSSYSIARISATEYIDTYKYEAINEMLEYGIPASITIAQGILESDCGNSPLAINAKNHFGIKCHLEWKGPTYIQDDDKKDECFRVYNDAKESYRDHSLFLKDRPRYASLFKLNIYDYKAWAYGLKEAGYATNPAYSEKLIKIIEENKLYLFDNVKNVKAIKHLKQKETIAVKNTPIIVVYHDILVNNRTPYIIVKQGDTYFSIAKEFDVDLRLLYHYNDVNKTDELKEGQYLYLKPKRINAEVDFYTFKLGDTMLSVSQQYGVKLKKLYKKNNMEYGTQPKIGDILSLQKRLRE